MSLQDEEEEEDGGEEECAITVENEDQRNMKPFKPVNNEKMKVDKDDKVAFVQRYVDVVVFSIRVREHTHTHIDRHAVSGVLASELYSREKWISTGIRGLDVFLGGKGLVRGEMMELCGPSGSGKSLLCHLLCACVASQKRNLRQEQVVYVDTRNTFSVKTLTDAATWIWNTNLVGEEKDGDLYTFQRSVLSRVRHVAAYELTDTFASLRNIDRMYTLSSSSSLGMIVVDSVTALLSSLIGGVKTGIGFAAMAEFGTSLKMLAQKHNASVIVTNGTVSANVGNESVSTLLSSTWHRRRKPALGRTWESVPSVRIWMERVVASGDLDSSSIPTSKFRTCMKTLKSPRISDNFNAKPFVFEIEI